MISRIQLLPALQPGDGDVIRFGEACDRAEANPETSWGQRAAFAVRDAGNRGEISKEVWPVGVYAVFGKTRWRSPRNGRVCAWYVIRDGDGFDCDDVWVDNFVDARGRFLSLEPAAQPAGGK
ncbi:MAG: hypothetical protein COU11_03200 [Candidatus Harrisonbacteria bacterium CG10_big_fil_rev_8_21_14_0_10_49_15]|uniref:Uncharacterized protein n=1 Tax=Candidatus Harrisonbacteria bacterium CG10_big_fil_rev_8_21_14_0_10_49_15 TaxID=1974587 RepID=A0A2H0UK99_9BACT|nr:MAG: hypothetical protein COU11_03200 [Candidatus Harrisonbacteria bacterium CG10_big_fil_rev_8_21_14_0_10_49_15]